MQTCAKDIMTTELILAHPEMTIEDAIKTLVNNRITGMPVVDGDQRIVGVVSEFDIIRTIESVDAEKPLDLTRAIDFSHQVTSVTETAPLPQILKLFVDKKVRRLPVLSRDNKLVGIITRRDIMRVLFYRSKTL
ncbi:MAG: CBS domain-containing protein [Deltaproteobacteria bacterium]|nr:CBS domain-containing protein [Deltaproteobacteria bacterium]